MQGHPTCACGCDEAPKVGNRFVHGHNRRGDIKPVRYVVEDRGYETPCWIWQLALNSMGYGQIGGGRGGHKLAHRVYYEQIRGPIPEGLELDHLCRVPACCNPDHLEPVTHAENMRRAVGTGRPATFSPYVALSAASMEWSTSLTRRQIADVLGVSPPTITRLLGAKR